MKIMKGIINYIRFKLRHKNCKYKYLYENKIICNCPGAADYLDYDLCNTATCTLLRANYETL